MVGPRGLLEQNCLFVATNLEYKRAKLVPPSYDVITGLQCHTCMILIHSVYNQ
jgi:hypothetical protein